MSTLYVENVPDDLYEALRKRAKENHRSTAAEVRSILERNVSTSAELRRRRIFLNQVKRLHSKRRSNKKFPSSEEMIRKDRSR
jgi:plasmid stability protein